ncbi:Ankyrin repeat-containing domain [Cinara cedri]|uniref:Ankyrin repeat-containing domain n=1 Tax=Cinara cedri TaxID=506608 RepID=A0A5E4MRW6_9HEMI|nr:Ankyrin repeat-containing domain [Cinara cedri]
MFDKSLCLDLQDACINGYTDGTIAPIQTYLIDTKGANINAVDTTADGTTTYHRNPMHVAPQGGNKDVIEFFSQQGVLMLMILIKMTVRLCNMLHGQSQLNLINVTKEGTLIWSKSIAAESGALDIVKYFYRKKHLDTNLKDAIVSHHWSSLHLAPQEGKLDILSILRKGANILVLDAHNYTPLHRADQQDKLNLVRYFIEEVEILVNKLNHWNE